MEILRGAVIDGRAENIRYRQNQLHQLHATLRNNAEGICDAISQDTGTAKAAAESEFFLTMDAVTKAYATLDFDRSLEEEYLVKEGKNNLSRRVGVGLVAIRPGTHSRFYSSVTPLAMAIAAGNCVLLELEGSNSQVDSVIKEVLPKSLDRDSFGISSKKLTQSEILKTEVFLDGTSPEQNTSFKTPEVSILRSIAILDRSANVQHAAKDIVKARLPPSDRSPYSPDLIIVNDFACEEFEKACLEWAGAGGSKNWSHTQVTESDGPLREIIAKAERAGQVSVTKSATSGLSLVKIKDRSCPLTVMKITGPYLIILPSTGIVDTATTQRGLPESIATYIYANPSTAKFLSEQIPSAASYINQIPSQLLIGPISFPHSLHPRYTTETFSIPRPQIITPVSPMPKSVQELRQAAVKPLKSTGQKPGHAVGFFEQGIFIGLGITSLLVLPVTGWVLWLVGRKGLSLLR